MTHDELRIARERNRQSGSNPFLIMLLFAALIAGLIGFGSQSSQRQSQQSDGPSVLTGLFTKP